MQKCHGCGNEISKECGLHCYRTVSPADCPECEGTGWTEEGWKNRDEGNDAFNGDCKKCKGAGRIGPGL